MLILMAAAVMAANLKSELLNTRPVVGTDYPACALRMVEQGATAVRITVDAAGAPAKCTVVQSSSSVDLDEHTCALYTHRAHFQPATNSDEVAVEGSYDDRATWTLRQSASPQN